MLNRLIVAASALAVIAALWAIAVFVPQWLDAGSSGAHDDEFGSADIYRVQDDASLRPAATGLAAEVWETFLRVTTPEYAAEVMTHYRVSDASDSYTLAYVQQGYDPAHWTLAANLATSEDRTQLIATLIHEYAHILSLSVSEVSAGARSCDTLEIAEGCAKDTSLIWAFEQLFWASYGDEAPDADNADGDLAWDFYEAHEEDFVSDYAATNVVEDFAESFMAWVIDDSERGDTVAASKLAFFDDYPELTEIRDRIRSEFAGELGLAN